MAWGLLESGWHANVRIAVDDRGYIARIETGDATSQSAAAAGTEQVAGFVVPGMANAHSHAFQRGMAGNTEYRLSARDSFWTWRQAMYALAEPHHAADLELIATQLFVEMLKAGYTSVAEFHYLHRRADGAAYAGANELWQASTSAADTAGIGLTLSAHTLSNQRLRLAAAEARAIAVRHEHRRVPAAPSSRA